MIISLDEALKLDADATQDADAILEMCDGLETLLFQDVSNMDVTDKRIAFDYFGKSTNQEKSGAFFFENIAGWSASAQLFK